MFSEIIHGLVWRTQIDNGVDPNCPEEDLSPCSLRIGIIPAGKVLLYSVTELHWKYLEHLIQLG